MTPSATAAMRFIASAAPTPIELPVAVEPVSPDPSSCSSDDELSAEREVAEQIRLRDRRLRVALERELRASASCRR